MCQANAPREALLAEEEWGTEADELLTARDDEDALEWVEGEYTVDDDRADDEVEAELVCDGVAECEDEDEEDAATVIE
jgi:hypothetical protein